MIFAMDESNAMALCHDVVHMALLEVARCRETNARGLVTMSVRCNPGPAKMLSALAYKVLECCVDKGR